MDDFFSEGYIFNQDENEESATEDENEDTSGGISDNEDEDKEEMYSPDEDESLTEEV